MSRAFTSKIFLALTVLWAGFVDASAEDKPDLSALIARVVARDEATQKELATMQYH